ncbi:MAG: hypothetical protein R6V62_02040 [Candidatus Fermentibacteraceae bacterium]
MDKDTETIASVAPTLCALMGIPAPHGSTAGVVRDAVSEADRVFGDGSVEKCLVFAPDAMGCHLAGRRPDLFDLVGSVASLRLSLRSVVPPKTPVCFASMFTGMTPEEHGIRKYEKPVLTCDTLFDALARSGKRIAVVSVRDCSIDVIFRGRSVDFFSEEYDPQVTDRALSLIADGKHDLVLAYHQEYDDAMHGSKPFSDEALKAAGNHVDAFLSIARAVDRHWGEFNRAVLFAPDHGAHTDEATGRGNHGDDIPEDMDVFHFWGFGKGRKAVTTRCTDAPAVR